MDHHWEGFCLKMEWKRLVSLLLTCAMLVTLVPTGLAEESAPQAEPDAVVTAAPSATPTATPTVTPSATPTATPSATPTATPTAEPTQAIETQEPTKAPASSEPTAEPTAASEPAETPTAEPTAASEPAETPTAEPTVSSEPTETPTAEPTASSEPAETPTAEPTEVPENSPEPTEVPSPLVIVALAANGETAFAVEYGMPEDYLATLLPATLTATLSDGATLSLDAKWACVDDGHGVAAYDPAPETQGDLPVYTFRAQVADLKGYALAEGVDMPTLTVRLKEPEIMLLSIVDIPDMPEGIKYDDGQSRLELATGYTFTTDQINDAIAKVEGVGHEVKSIYSFAAISKDSAAAINLPFTSRGPIAGGTFNSSVTVENSSKISGGTFTGAVSSKGAITGGTFKGSVTLSRGSVEGGKFESGSSIALRGASLISGGDFYTDKIVGGGGQGAIGIFGGTFHVPLTLISDIPTLYGGTFMEPVIIPNGVSVGKGTFMNTVTNNGKITGGEFNGELVNNGSIEGNGAAPTINGKLNNATGTVKNAVFGESAEITEIGKLYVPFTVYGPSGEPETTVVDKAIYDEDALTSLKKNYTGADNANWKLFLNGEESDLTGRKMSLDGSQNHFKHNSVWRIVGDVLEVMGDWDGADAPEGGYKSVVINAGVTLSGGVFACSGAVTNNGTITKGSFSGSGSFTNKGTISGGEFSNTRLSNTKEITGGTFNRDVVNNGTISGGDFNAAVTNGINGKISSGKFTSKVANAVTNNGEITGGTFRAQISNSGVVSGGSFSTQFLNNASGTVCAGENGAPSLSGRLINNGTVDGGTVSATVENNGTVDGGSFTAQNSQIMLKNTGTISGTAKIAGWVTNNGVISGGTFEKTSHLTNSKTISAGTFSGAVANNGAISGGTFDADSTLANASDATITDGKFSGTVENDGTISGGTFETASTVTNNKTISGGTFSGTVTNQGTVDDENGTGHGGEISGGAFSGSVENTCMITGGVFSSTVTNRGIVRGGASFSGTVNNEHTIYRSTFETSSTLNNNGMVAESTINGTINTKENTSIPSNCTFGPSATVGDYAEETIEIAYYIVANPGDAIGKANIGYYGEKLIEALTRIGGALKQDQQWFWYPSNVSDPDSEIALVTSSTFTLSDNHCVFVKHARLPLIQWPTASAITYGQPLSASTLTENWLDGFEDRGSFKWKADDTTDPDAIFPTVDYAAKTGYVVEFVPSDEFKEYYKNCTEDYMTEHVTLEVKPLKLRIEANGVGFPYNSLFPSDIQVTYTVIDEEGTPLTKYPNGDQIEIEAGTLDKDLFVKPVGIYSGAVPQPKSVTITNSMRDCSQNYEITLAPADVEILPKLLSSNLIDWSVEDCTYTGKACMPQITATDRGIETIELLANVAFDCEFKNNVNAGMGTATVIVHASSASPNYTDIDDDNNEVPPTLTFTIHPSEFAADLLTKQWTYTGDAIKPQVSVTLADGVSHALEDDVEIAYKDNVNPGEATVTVTPKEGGNLTGDAQTLHFNIKKSLEGIHKDDFKVQVDAQTYTGKPIEPAITLTDKGETVAKENYEVSYESNTDAGMAKVTVTGKGDYYGGTLTTYFIINPKPLTDANVIVTVPDELPYTGTEHRPKVEVEVDGVALSLGDDYSVEYFDNTDVGDAYLVVSGMGNYAGNVNKKFKITQANIQDATLSPYPIPDQAYTGSEIRPEITLTFNGVALKENEDYTLSFENNVALGTALMTITGIGDFKGSIDDVPFKITFANIEDAELSPIPDQTYTGSAILPKITLSFNGVELKENEDYTLTVTGNVNVGEAELTFKGQNDFEGSHKDASFKIVPAPIASAKLDAIPKQTYTGSAICPEVSLTFNGATLKKETDYTLSFEDNVDAGTATVTITGTGNFKDSVDKTFTIGPADIKGASLSPIPLQTYTGSAIHPAITLTFNGVALEEEKDFTLSLKDNVNAGEATVTITGTGNFEGSIKDLSFMIDRADIKDAKLEAIPDQTYTGSEICPELTLTFGETTLKKGTDYTVAFNDNVETGEATVTITGTGNLKNSKTASFKIVAAPIADAKLDAIPKQTYTGSAICPEVSLTFNGVALEEDKDYTLSFKDNVNAGTATVTVTGQGHFTGSVDKTFTIGPADISGASLDAIPPQAYTGSAIHPAITLTFNGVALEEDKDYTLSFKNNVNAGTATVTITGEGNFKGSIKGVSFGIVPADIMDAKLDAIPGQPYTGSAICPELTLTLGDVTLKKGTDYTVAFENNVEIGTATVKITGKGNFVGSMIASFEITKVPLDAKMADAIPDQDYTGEAVTPKVSLKWGKQKLVEGEDYTVSCKNNTAAGVATAVVTAKDGSIFSGKVELAFTIVKSMTDFASDFSLEKIPDQTHTGKAITPKITLKDGSKTLKEGTDYTLSYENNVKVGTATVKITGKGAYSGTLRATFTIKAKPASSSSSSSSGSSSSSSSGSSSGSSSESSFVGDDSYTPQEQLVLYGLGQASDLYADEAMEGSLNIVFDDENAAQDYDLTIVETPAQGAQQAQNALLVQAATEAQDAPRHLDLSLSQANRLHNGQSADLLIFRNGGAALSVAFEDLFGGEIAKLARLALDGKLDDALEAAQGDLSSALEGQEEAKLAYSELAKVRFALHLDPVFGPDGSVTGYEVCALMLCGDAALDVTALLPTLRLLLLTDAPEGVLMELTDADGQTSALAEAVAGALLDTDRKSADQYEVRDHASDVRYEKASSLSELLDLVGLRVDVTASGAYRLTPKE